MCPLSSLWNDLSNLDIIVQAYMSESFNNFEHIMKALLSFTGTSVHGIQMGWNLQINERIQREATAFTRCAARMKDAHKNSQLKLSQFGTNDKHKLFLQIYN